MLSSVGGGWGGGSGGDEGVGGRGARVVSYYVIFCHPPQSTQLFGPLVFSYLLKKLFLVFRLKDSHFLTVQSFCLPTKYMKF